MEQFINIGSVALYETDGAESFDYARLFKPADYATEDLSIKLKDNMGFGASMDIQDDRVIVGCPNESSNDAVGDFVWANENLGAVYVFNKDTGALIQKILPDNTPGTWTSGTMSGKVRRQHRFGFSVASGDDFIVIGAPGYVDNTGSTEYEYNGVVYVYKWNSTSEIYELTFTATPSTKIANNRFGDTVLVDGNSIVIANSPKTGTSNSGTIRYITLNDDRTASTNDVKITNTHASWQYSVAADQGRVAIGNHTVDTVIIHTIVDGFARLDYRITEDRLTSFEFGYDLEFNEDKLLIGCPNGYYKLGVVLRLGQESGIYTLV